MGANDGKPKKVSKQTKKIEDLSTTKEPKEGDLPSFPNLAAKLNDQFSKSSEMDQEFMHVPLTIGPNSLKHEVPVDNEDQPVSEPAPVKEINPLADLKEETSDISKPPEDNRDLQVSVISKYF